MAEVNVNSEPPAEQRLPWMRRGGAGRPDLTFLRFRPGAGLGRRRGPGAAASGLFSPRGEVAPLGPPGTGQSLSPHPSPALERKAEQQLPPWGYRGRHLVRPPLGPARKQGLTARVGPGRAEAALRAGQRPRGPAFSRRGSQPCSCSQPRLASQDRLWVGVGFPTFQELSLTKVGL